MRYSLIAAFVGTALAAPYVETVYDTKVYTITSCGPEVTNCPGKMTSTVVPVATTTCPEGEHKTTSAASAEHMMSSAPAVYMSTSSAAPPPPPPSTKKAEETTPCPTTVTKQAVETVTTSCPSTTLVVIKTSAPAKGPETHPAPPPYNPAPTGGAVKPTGSASTGMMPQKTTSAMATKTTSPAVYTGAASHVQVAGLVGAGAIAAFFL